MDAEDVVQEALIRAWRGRARCATPERPLAWLLTITRNEARRQYARRREATVLDDPDTEDPVALGVLDAAPDRLDLRRALADLSTHERALVTLRYGAGFKQPEVAEALGIPEGTAKVQLHRIRKRLRTQLEESR